MVNRALAKDLRSAFFHSVVEEAVHKFVSEPHSVDTVATMMIDATLLPSWWPKFIKNDVGMSSINKAKK